MFQIALLKSFHHPHIVEFDDLEVRTSVIPLLPTLSVKKWNAKHVFILMQYCDFGNLKAYLSKHRTSHVDEPEARYFLRQLCSGILFLHSRAVIHRDIKSENLLLTGPADARTLHRPILKISDFGIAAAAAEALSGLGVDDDDELDELSEGRGDGFVSAPFPTVTATETVGTLLYMAPEVASKRRPYDATADWWSVGCVFHELLAGFPPFARAANVAPGGNGNKGIETLLALIVGTTPDPIPPASGMEASDEAREVLAGLLQRNPDYRYDDEDIKHLKYLDMDFCPGPYSEENGLRCYNEAEAWETTIATAEDGKKALELYATAVGHLLAFLDFLGPKGGASEAGTRIRGLTDAILRRAEALRDRMKHKPEEVAGTEQQGRGADTSQASLWSSMTSSFAAGSASSTGEGIIPWLFSLIGASGETRTPSERATSGGGDRGPVSMASTSSLWSSSSSIASYRTSLSQPQTPQSLPPSQPSHSLTPQRSSRSTKPSNGISVAQDHLQRGSALESQGRLPEALSSYEQGLTLLHGAMIEETDPTGRAALEVHMRAWLERAEKVKKGMERRTGSSSGRASDRDPFARRGSGLIQIRYQSSVMDGSDGRGDGGGGRLTGSSSNKSRG
ncbi:Serine/threonine-protein kinase ulk3 [Phlyctochytrium bullatum]|nr:Serine/threonine-protein kinase ulk3 [Phlyctochytrium bullatum]